MIMELVFGSTLCVIGLSLLLPTRTWLHPEKRKYGGQPSKGFTIAMCVLGFVCTAAGAYLLYLAAK